MRSVLTVEVRAPSGERRTLQFDSAFDRRVIIGRAAECDVVVYDGGISRKHTMLICTPGGWRVQDLGSTNGTRLNGKEVDVAPLSSGDVLQFGKTEVVLIDAGASPPKLIVDLDAGTAKLGETALPLSAAELIWFGFLAWHRAQGEGWVLTGRDGHSALATFTAPLLQRDWAREVKTKPLLDLARGEDVDDEDLKNLRGKMAQKLKGLCRGPQEWMAALVVPEVEGKNRQRLPLPSARCVVTATLP